MERTMSVEEKIKRAEEIYLRRKGDTLTANNSKRVAIPQNDSQNRDIKLLKKMIIQIVVCILIYIIIYIIQNSQFIFSEQFLNKAREILSYDTNFVEIYENIKNGLITINNNLKQTENTNKIINNEDKTEQQNEETNTQTQQEDINNNVDMQAIGGAVEETPIEEEPQSQEQIDINNVKNTTTFIKPIEGKITSIFGYRETATGSVPKNHTGTDIAANLGTKIKSATDGEVVLSSEEGDYGKHLKIQIGEVSIIYAHCNNLYVKQGEYVKQGQEIAEVGSTGNSTGPHLHFEIRYQERIVDPQKILDM